jgi:hypothetical protein
MSKRSRRLNYQYLTKLSDRLETLGHSMQYEIPMDIIEAQWYQQRDWMKNELGLEYCVRCKLPISREDSAGADLCLEHSESIRRNMYTKRFAKLNPHPLVTAELMRGLRSKLETRQLDPIVGVSKLETPTNGDVKSVDEIMDIIRRKGNDPNQA